jgi:Methyltransferase domain
MQNRLDNVLARIAPQDRVLDIGAWNEVIPRADVIIDLNPYDTRHVKDPGAPERFRRDTWIQGDVHSRELWNRFGDNEFDFIICSHFLEDIRDPLFVCEQMNRVGRAGYIESPSRFRECAKTRPNDINTGYDHHRWIVDVVDGDVVLTPKMGWAHAFDLLTGERRSLIYRPEVQFVALFWRGSFNYYERFPKGNVLEAANLLHFYDTVRVRDAPWVHSIENGLSGSEIKPGSCLWVTEYRLPVESAPDFESYQARALELVVQGTMPLVAAQPGENVSESLPTEIAAREARIRQREETLAGLTAGASWKLVQWLVGFRARIAPRGTRRDRLAQRLGRWLTASAGGR